MSLNRCEQVFFDYLSQRAEERQYWQEKVRRLGADEAVSHSAIMALERDLWAAFTERSQVVPTLRQWVQIHGAARTSMRNLAEYLVRLWVAPRPKPKNPPSVKSL
jgi:hypothetical protein